MQEFEFHDSVISKIERNGSTVRISFESAVIRYGTGPREHHIKQMTVLLTGVTSFQGPADLSVEYDIWEGELQVDSKVYRNVFPVPIDFEKGNVRFKCDLDQEGQLEIIANGLDVRFV